MAQDPRVLSQKAEKALLSASSGWWLFGGRTEKYEDAVDLFTQAANTFFYKDQGKEAGIMYERAAQIQKNELNESNDAANTLIQASKAYGSEAPEDTVRVLRQVIHQFTLGAPKGEANYRRAAPYQGKIGTILARLAAKHQNLADKSQSLADDYEKKAKAKANDLDGKELQECKDLQSASEQTAMAEGQLAREASASAIEAYCFGATWLEKDEAVSNANKLWLQAAELLSLQDEYQKAVDIFVKVAETSIIDRTLKFGVKDYLLHAGICQLGIDDIVATTRALDSFTALDPSFVSTMEYQFLVELTEAYNRGDSKAFSDATSNYNEMKTLDDWKVRILVRIKRRIEKKETEEVENFN